MAKNAHKTNALGMELRPGSFKTVEKEHTPPVEAPANLLAGLEKSKSEIKGFSFTLKVETVDKLRAVAKSQNVSASKLLEHILSEVLK